MLFDPRPKINKKELFGRDKELEVLHKNEDDPIIVITGIRRIGKTSLLNVFLNELNIPSIIIDLRNLPINYGYKDFYDLLSKSLTSRLDKLLNIIKSLSGISIKQFGVEIKWRGHGSINFSSLLDSLNRQRIIIAFDEAQRLRGPRSKEILNAIAHSYDYNRNITFILTGSEVGLLYSFLGIDNPESPLYGRYYFNLTLSRFERDVSIDFLKAGFSEVKIDVKTDIIEDAINNFDGIPGWLSFFGYEYIKGNKNIKIIKELAINLALKELENISKERGKRYALVLKGIAEGANGWSKLKRYVDEKSETTISQSVLYNILKNLEDMSIIHNFNFLDPLHKEAALML